MTILRTYQLFWNNSVWPVNHLVVSIGAFHISLWPQKYSRGSGRKRTKNKRTIWAWVNSMCKKGKFVTLHSLCICRLSWACSFRKISAGLLGMPTHLDWSSFTADRCRLRTAKSSGLSSSLPLDSFSCDWSLLLSVVDCPSASPFTNCLLCVPFSNSFSGVPLPTTLASFGSAFFPPLPVSSEISILSPLFGFAPRQTKGSSA